MNAHYLRRHVRNIARHYARDLPTFARFSTTFRPAICPFDVLIEEVPRGSAVLDVGCGNGLFLYLLYATGRLSQGTGVDVSKSCVESGVNRLRNLAVRPTAVRLERHLTQANWPNGPFDVVSLVDVMHHVSVDDRRSLLHESMLRVKIGGLLLYKDMRDLPYWRASANRLHDLIVANEIITYTPIASIESWTQEKGFSVMGGLDCNILWYGHQIRIFRRNV